MIDEFVALDAAIWCCRPAILESNFRGAFWRASLGGIPAFPNGTSIFAKMRAQLRLEVAMDKNVAIRLDGMLMGVRGNLDGIAHYMKNNLSAQEYAALIGHIRESMGELIDISTSLHQSFSDIVPKELRPGGT